MLDIEQPHALLNYLRQAGHITAHETPQLHPLKGGVSNRTVLVQRENGESWVLKQALAKLRVPVDWFSSPERIHREAAGLRWLAELTPLDTVPDFIFEDHDHHILAMAAVPQPHQNWKQMLLDAAIDMGHIDQFARLLATIHSKAFARQEEIKLVFDDRSFFDSLRLEPYYSYTASQVPAAADFLQTLIQDTRARRLTLVHGDYSPKNILVHRDRLILLDHEVIHFGDPAFDLGFSLTHLLSKAHHVAGHRQAFADAALAYWLTYWESVRELDWAYDLEAQAVRHTLGCLLARVKGRSQLEYMSQDGRNRQCAVVVRLIEAPPSTMSDLVQRFINDLSSKD